MPGFDSYTKLLIHFNGADGATTYTAETGQTITFVGTAQLDTAVKKLGSASLMLDGDSDYASIPQSADFAWGTDPFTIDFWWYLPTGKTAAYIFNQHDASNQYRMAMYLTKTEAEFWYYNPDSHAWITYIIFPNPGLSNDTWYHIALVRNGTAAQCYKLYVNGTALGDASLFQGSWAGACPQYDDVFEIGWDYNGSYSGIYLDEFRVSKGIARWTSNFTPPTWEYSAGLYTRQGTTLPSDATDLATPFVDTADYTKVEAVDGVRVDQLAAAGSFAVFQFKDVIPGKNVATLTWTGQTDLAGSTKTIYLQAYNRTTTTWINVATNNSVGVNTNFTLTGTISGLTDYLDVNGEIACRVYQEAA